ncbi:MAG: MarR family transcriptional regulator [Gemmatimonadota bacterium]|jgi:DNA-binding MarR family transcriptional regulator|nr:hypothetical protein [Gemmatimonadota bacterium]MDP6528190.1 MarR family transcriptional regulator [Gemmatimonadota bacterium]MDP6802011.1 MarR family transcriptional regulator [Gemmatimonadota bacterium]MDP7031359.1 MarR family transcriptional regulator [Gemmatimonadota bacterium]
MKTDLFHIVSRVDRLGERRDAYRRDLVRQHQVTPPLVVILRLLESVPGMTMVDMARRLGSSVPTVQSRFARLEDLGLIRRTRSRDDRRKVGTRLTRKGKSLLARVPMAGAGRILDALESGSVTPRSLRRMVANLEQVERLLFPDASGKQNGRKKTGVWMR